jgi:hypothetical protein
MGQVLLNLESNQGSDEINPMKHLKKHKKSKCRGDARKGSS